MVSYIIAVDGGATKTTLSLRDLEGNIYFEHTSTGSNYQTIGEEKAKNVLTKLLQDAYHHTKLQRVVVAAFAMSGIDTKYDLEIVKRIIHQSINQSAFHIQKCLIENDVEMTLRGLTGGKSGALVLSGTGSVAFATDGRGKFERVGGFGHRAGDEGSGYWIGRQILQTIFQCEDGRNEKPTILKDLVFELLQILSIEELIQWLYHPSYTNAQIASLAQVLPKAISLGDNYAIQIARNAAYELSNMTVTVLKKIDLTDKPTVYLNGGVFKNQSIILNLYQQFTVRKVQNISFHLCKQNPIDYIAKRAISSLK